MANRELATTSVQLGWEKDDVRYTLVPSVTQVKWSEESGYSPAALSCRIIRRDGVEVEEVSSVEGCELHLLIHGMSLGVIPGGEAVNIGVLNKVDSFTFELREAGSRTVIDRATVAVVTDGQDGEPGKPGDDGNDAVSYTLIPSVGAVKYSTMASEGEKYSPKAISCAVVRHCGEVQEELDDIPAGLKLYPTFDGAIQSIQLWPGAEVSIANMPTRPRRFGFCLVKADGTVVARADIPVITNGPRIPFPRLWKDYPEGYEFQQGADGEERVDLVLYEYAGKVYAASCKKTHVKSTEHQPWDGTKRDDECWDTAQEQSIIATRILFAELQYVRNLMAEYIHMEDADGNLLFEVYDGNVVANTGTFRNVKVSTGDDGQRIELDPESKSVRIYDADGSECARLDGSAYTADSVMPKGTFDLKPSGTAATTGVTLRAHDASAEMTRRVTAEATAGSPVAESIGKVQVKVRASVEMDASAAVAAFGPAIPDSTVMKPVKMKSATLYCRLDTWVKVLDEKGAVVKDEAGKDVERVAESHRVAIASAAETITGEWTSGTVTREISLSVPEGRTEVGFELEASGAPATAHATLQSAKFVSDSFMSRYFSNGFALVKNAANYLIALLEKDSRKEDVMRLRLGGEFIADGVQQPKVVYMGRVTDTSNDASVAPSLTHLTRPTGITAVPTIKKGATYKEGYTLTIPAAYGLTPETAIVEVAGVGPIAGSSDSPAKATEKSRRAGTDGSLVVTVWVSDDASPNYGGFQIKISKL